MVRCLRCGQTCLYRTGARFCTGCGTNLYGSCAHCQGELLPGDRHCGFCGEAQPGVQAAPGAGAAQPAAPVLDVNLGLDRTEFRLMAEEAKHRAEHRAQEEEPVTKKHLDQADIDQMFM